MENNKIKKSFRIESNLLNLVEKYLKDSKYNFSDLVNAAIMNFISSDDNIDRSRKNTLLLKENNKEVELRISISKSEYKILVDLSNKHGFNSATKEAKFLLLNLLNCDSPIFNNIEMEELRKSNYELNMVGRNINQMLKVLYEQDLKNFKVNYENLISVVKVVNDKISAVSDKIEKYIKILNLKLK